MSLLPFIDGHLDLALNALHLRRDITASLSRVRAAEADRTSRPFDIATVTLPELRRGGAVMVLSTLLAHAKPYRVGPGSKTATGLAFADHDQTHAMAMGQLDYYRCLADRGMIKLVLTRDDLPGVDAVLPDDAPLPLLVTLEGADPLRDPDDLHRWHAAGVRTLMLAHFGRSAYAHGTPMDDDPHPFDVDGPLSPAGRDLLKVMAELRMPLDLSHLSDTSLYEALDAFAGPIYASHTASRSLNPQQQRNLPDDAVRVVAARGGVIGVALYNPYLTSGYRRDSPRASCDLDTVVDHLDALAEAAGGPHAVALGTDMDGGYGRSHTPAGIDGSGDLPKLAAQMLARGWAEGDVRAVFAGNWHRFWSAHLPPADGSKSATLAT